MTFHFNSELEKFDLEINGLESGKLYFVSSSGGLEATAFCNTVTLGVAENGTKVSYLSVRDSCNEIFRDFVKCKSGISYKDIGKPEISDKIKQTLAYLSALPIYMIDNDYLSKDELLNQLEKEVDSRKSKVIVIDRLDYTDFFTNITDDEQSALFKELRDFAIYNDVCLVISIPVDRRINVTDTKLHFELFEDSANYMIAYLNNQTIDIPLYFASDCTKITEGVAS